jgi:hypothetical protein
MGLISFITSIRNELARKKAARAIAESLPEEHALELLQICEQSGDAPSRGAIVALPDPKPSGGEYRLNLPGELAEYPWAGNLVRARLNQLRDVSPVNFELDGIAGSAPASRVFRPPFLRKAGRNGQHMYSVARMVRHSPALRDELIKLYPESAELLLESVFERFRLFFDERGIRIGLPPAWIQSGRFHRCGLCGRPMRLIIQMPGELVARRLSEGSFYLFGCPSHPGEQTTDEDWG